MVASYGKGVGHHKAGQWWTMQLHVHVHVHDINWGAFDHTSCAPQLTSWSYYAYVCTHTHTQPKVPKHQKSPKRNKQLTQPCSLQTTPTSPLNITWLLSLHWHCCYIYNLTLSRAKALQTLPLTNQNQQREWEERVRVRPAWEWLEILMHKWTCCWSDWVAGHCQCLLISVFPM